MSSLKPARAAAAAALVVLAGLTGSAVVSVTTSVTADSASGKSGRIKNVIYLLGDGMGRTHVTAARGRYHGASGHLVMETLPATGQVSTYAVNKKSGQPGASDFSPNLVTDSASAATAWASGVKTYNAALGVDAKGKTVPTLMELAKNDGYRTGNVSTAEITDATPAGQMSHALARGCQGPSYSAAACQDLAVTGAPLPTSDVRVTPIADQIARNGTADVILGGGLSRFDMSDETALRDQGYSVLGSPASQTVATQDDLAAARGRKVFGLFSRGNLTVEKFKRENPASVQAKEPTLPVMTAKAIDLLSANVGKGGKGFYLQVEGALIDKRSHANDAAQTLEETKAFDDAVKVALDFAEKDRHTLVIVTADHECAGFNIIEKGTYTNPEAVAPPANADSGNSANNSGPTRPSSGAKDPVRSTSPVNGAGAGDPNNFAPATFRTPDDPAGVRDGTTDASLWLTYLSGNHTGADVPIFSYGAGSSLLEGSIDNTDLFDVVGGALGVTGQGERSVTPSTFRSAVDGSVTRAASGADPSGARTTLPGLTPATGEPVLAGLATAGPAPGTVTRLSGPFDDRFTWSRLRLHRGGASGTVTVTSDVSDLLELQVLAGFYDRDGRLLGTSRLVHHATVHDDAVGTLPAGTEDFTVAVPERWRGATVSAAVGVPVLVNE